ncbi:MAG TPA: hypothetical protein VIS96_09750 [Terrimicrobiaceae bacterium]
MELATSGLEPLLGLPVGDDSHNPLRIRLKFLDRVEATGESAENQLRDLRQHGGALAEIANGFRVESGEGERL